MRPSLLLLSALLTACVDFSPFDVEPTSGGRIRHNLLKLEALPAPNGPWTLALVADSQGHPEQLEAIVGRIMAREDVSLVMHGGDLTEFGTQVEFDWVTEELDRLQVPVFSAIGNHDALANGTVVYERMFGPLDYSFRYGGLKFVVLNNNVLEFLGGAPDYDWLEAQLSDLQGAQAAVILMHIPPGTAEFSETRFNELITTYPVIGILCGHVNDHTLEVYEGVRVYSVDAVGRGGWGLVTFDGTSMQVEFCVDDTCKPGTLKH